MLRSRAKYQRLVAATFEFHSYKSRWFSISTLNEQSKERSTRVGNTKETYNTRNFRINSLCRIKICNSRSNAYFATPS